MATVKQHYNEVLSDVYSWMFGGFENEIQRNTEFIKKHKLTPQGSGIVIDLGAGCGFQSIPLARAGYSVTAIDLDAKLLSELERNSGDRKITTIQGDLIDFDKNLNTSFELIVCMTDTILHYELKDADRVLPVRSDENIIFTCFLEYEPETVKVHDIVYKKSNGAWSLSKSFYRKLRLPKAWVHKQLSQCGFSKIDSTVEKGVITLTASV